MKREIVTTADGSKTIFISEMDEHYHSSHGALQEARHVFIESGLKEVLNDTIVVFEMGFGTGLNAFLTLEFSIKNRMHIDYFGIEAYPVEKEHYSVLDYANKIDNNLQDEFIEMHESEWDKLVAINEFFRLKKIHAKIEGFESDYSFVDVIYFDAFGHRAQEEMWTIDVLKKMYDMLKPNGVLVTYAARGQFKRDLKSLGFSVEPLPGPPGKREMTRARKV